MAYRKFAMFNFVSPVDNVDGNVFQYGGIVYTFQDESKPVVFVFAKVASANFTTEANSLKSNQITTHQQQAPFKQSATQTTWPKFSQP